MQHLTLMTYSSNINTHPFGYVLDKFELILMQQSRFYFRLPRLQSLHEIFCKTLKKKHWQKLARKLCKFHCGICIYSNGQLSSGIYSEFSTYIFSVAEFGRLKIKFNHIPSGKENILTCVFINVFENSWNFSTLD